MKKTVYVTKMEIDSCDIGETKEFEADFNEEGNKFTIFGKEHIAMEIDMPILCGKYIFVMTEEKDPDYIKFILFKRELQRVVEKQFEAIGGLFGA